MHGIFWGTLSAGMWKFLVLSYFYVRAYKIEQKYRLKIEATSLTRHDALHLKPGNFNFNIF